MAGRPLRRLRTALNNGAGRSYGRENPGTKLPPLDVMLDREKSLKFFQEIVKKKAGFTVPLADARERLMLTRETFYDAKNAMEGAIGDLVLSSQMGGDEKGASKFEKGLDAIGDYLESVPMKSENFYRMKEYEAAIRERSGSSPPPAVMTVHELDFDRLTKAHASLQDVQEKIETLLGEYDKALRSLGERKGTPLNAAQALDDQWKSVLASQAIARMRYTDAVVTKTVPRR